MCRAFLHKAVSLVILASLTFAVWHDSAAARVWIVGFWSDKFAVAKLTDLKLDESGHFCAAGFRPVRLSSQINLRDVGQMTFGTSSPEHYTSTKTDTTRIRKNLFPKLDVDVKGCAFSKHFLPHSGYVDSSGAFGTSEIKPTRFHFQASGGENDASFGYTAQLSGSLPALWIAWNRTFKDSTHLDADKVLGSLRIGVSNDPHSILSGEYAKDSLKLNLSNLRIIVVSDD
jgi:hypothetical protein